MLRERLYVVYGAGTDATGLVGAITTPIATAGGNIVDLRQDVLHGLFTIYLVVDLGATELRMEELGALIAQIGEDTGLRLTVEKYNPVPANVSKQVVLMILLGKDKPGIISSVAQTLGRFKVNIELAWNIGREGVFLMELLVDIGNAAIPPDNLETTLVKTMRELGIEVVFQKQDVYNRKKRVILFDVCAPLLEQSQQSQILEAAGIGVGALRSALGSGTVLEQLSAAARLLEGVPVDVLNQVVKSVVATRGTRELIVTLRSIGYRVAIKAPVFSQLTESLALALGAEHAFGIPLLIDNDTRSFTGEIAIEERQNVERAATIEYLARQEAIAPQEISLICGRGAQSGMGLSADLSVLLGLYNNRVVSQETLIAVIAGLGLVATTEK